VDRGVCKRARRVLCYERTSFSRILIRARFIPCLGRLEVAPVVQYPSTKRLRWVQISSRLYPGTFRGRRTSWSTYRPQVMEDGCREIHVSAARLPDSQTVSSASDTASACLPLQSSAGPACAAQPDICAKKAMRPCRTNNEINDSERWDASYIIRPSFARF
jgi:hypothetical protein